MDYTRKTIDNIVQCMKQLMSAWLDVTDFRLKTSESGSRLAFSGQTIIVIASEYCLENPKNQEKTKKNPEKTKKNLETTKKNAETTIGRSLKSIAKTLKTIEPTMKTIKDIMKSICKPQDNQNDNNGNHTAN